MGWAIYDFETACEEVNECRNSVNTTYTSLLLDLHVWKFALRTDMQIYNGITILKTHEKYI